MSNTPISVEGLVELGVEKKQDIDLENLWIEVCDLEKFIPDIKNQNLFRLFWFKFDCDLMDNVKIQRLNSDQKLLYLALVSQSVKAVRFEKHSANDLETFPEHSQNIPRIFPVQYHNDLISFWVRSKNKTRTFGLLFLQQAGLIRLFSLKGKERRGEEIEKKLNENIYPPTQEKPRPKPVKETKKADKPKSRRKNLKFEPADLELAEKWLEYGKSKLPSIDAWPETAANELRKVREHLKYTHDEMTILFEWMIQDVFWSDNALSPMGLMNKSKTNELRKIENLVNAFMKEYRKAKKKHDVIQEFLDEPDNQPRF